MPAAAAKYAYDAMAGAAAYGRAAQSALSPAQASLILHESLCREVMAAKAAYEAKRLDTMCMHQQKCMRVLLALQNDLKPKPGDTNVAILSGFYMYLFKQMMTVLRNDDVASAFDAIISMMNSFNKKLSAAARAAA